LLTRNVETGREVLRTLLAGPLRFAPVLEDGRRGYRFTGAVVLERLVAGVVDLSAITRRRMASPAGFAAGECPCLPMDGAADLIAA
jgi:hypothetical protein